MLYTYILTNLTNPSLPKVKFRTKHCSWAQFRIAWAAVTTYGYANLTSAQNLAGYDFIFYYKGTGVIGITADKDNTLEGFPLNLKAGVA
jgi:hypothetical protein